MDPLEVLKEINNLGCSDEKKCAIAYRCYINLRGVCGYDHIEKLYDESNGEIYFKVSKSNKTEIHLPLSSVEEIDLLRIEQLQGELCKNDNRFILAICDPDSTVMYYSLTNGLMEKRGID